MIDHREKIDDIDTRINKSIIYFMNYMLNLDESHLQNYHKHFEGKEGFFHPLDKILFIFKLEKPLSTNEIGVRLSRYNKYYYDKDYVNVSDISKKTERFLYASHFLCDLLYFLDTNKGYADSPFENTGVQFYFEELFKIIQLLGYEIEEADNKLLLVNRDGIEDIETEALKEENPNIYRLVMKFYSLQTKDNEITKIEILNNLAYHIEEDVLNVPKEVFDKNRQLNSYKGIWNFVRHNNDNPIFNDYKKWFEKKESKREALDAILLLYRLSKIYGVTDKIHLSDNNNGL